LCGVQPRGSEPVLVCAPAYAIPAILPDLDVLRQITYAPIARVALGYRRDQVGHALDGFGVLVPAREEFEILGIFFSSSLFSNRAPEGHVLLSVFLGGARNPSIPRQSPEAIQNIAMRDVQRLLGVTGAPVYCDVEVNPRAIPQYETGFGDFKAAMSRIEASHPGLFLAGAWRDGVSVADCIGAGFKAADRIAEFLSHETQDRTAADQHRLA
jgi:oxygen-dependent protoporphyrinogen oxidase